MATGAPRTITWGEFTHLESELATFGADLLTRAPAYLATVRRSGAPRVRPVTPIFAADGLFLYMEPTSPKARDLRQQGWFSLHNGVPDNAGTGGEFCVEGRGLEVGDREMWSQVAAAASYTPLDRYILFEFQLSEARCHGYGDVPLPSTQRWSIDRLFAKETTMAVSPIPPGVPSVRPYLFVDGAAEAIAFYEKAFGASERMRLEIPGGKIAHAEIQIGDSVVSLCDPLPNFVSRPPTELGGTTSEVLMYVEDVDTTVKKAVEAGATVTTEIADQPWGDRSGIITDPFGQVWLVASRLEDVSPDEIAERMENKT